MLIYLTTIYLQTLLSNIPLAMLPNPIQSLRTRSPHSSESRTHAILCQSNPIQSNPIQSMQSLPSTYPISPFHPESLHNYPSKETEKRNTDYGTKNTMMS